MKLPRYQKIFGILIYQCLPDFGMIKALIKASVKNKTAKRDVCERPMIGLNSVPNVYYAMMKIPEDLVSSMIS